jgi:hypothetical protein
MKGSILRKLVSIAARGMKMISAKSSAHVHLNNEEASLET